MTDAIDSEPLWKPNPATVGDTRMAQLMRATGHGSYADLWRSERARMLAAEERVPLARAG